MSSILHANFSVSESTHGQVSINNKCNNKLRNSRLARPHPPFPVLPPRPLPRHRRASLTHPLPQRPLMAPHREAVVNNPLRRALPAAAVAKRALPHRLPEPAGPARAPPPVCRPACRPESRRPSTADTTSLCTSIPETPFRWLWETRFSIFRVGSRRF